MLATAPTSPGRAHTPPRMRLAIRQSPGFPPTDRPPDRVHWLKTTTRTDAMSVRQRPQASTQPTLMGEPSISDARLVDSVRRGDERAFEELVHRYERRVLGVVRRFIADPGHAEDLAQETFLRVFRSLDQFDPSRRFGPWVFQIAVNLSLDWLRRRQRRVWLRLFTDRSSDRPPDPPAPNPHSQDELQQEVQRVLERIPEKYRTVLVLRDLENFSTSDIAAILKRKETTIRWRLAEARNRFQELWEQRTGPRE